MTRRNLLAAAVWTAGSFALSLAVLAPAHLTATSPAPSANLVVDAAKLTQDGAELYLQYAGKSATVEPIRVQPGDPLPLALVGTNTQDQSVRVSTKILILATLPTSQLSRVMPTPTQVWQHEELLILAPRESRTVALSPDVSLPEGSSVSVRLICGQQTIEPLRFFVMRTSS